MSPTDIIDATVDDLRLLIFKEECATKRRVLRKVVNKLDKARNKLIKEGLEPKYSKAFTEALLKLRDI